VCLRLCLEVFHLPIPPLSTPNTSTVGSGRRYSWPTSQSTCSVSWSNCRGPSESHPSRTLVGEQAPSQRSTWFLASRLIALSLPTSLGFLSRPWVASAGWMTAAVASGDFPLSFYRLPYFVQVLHTLATSHAQLP
jgi:hypothetical protein